MRVTQLGRGTPSVAVVGAIHGDEPCGARAIERVLIEDPDVRRPVKFVVANERALEGGVRYIDADLNRAFKPGGDPRDHEHGLAHRLAEELAGCTVLSLHATQSHSEPFAIVNDIDPAIKDLIHWLPIEALVTVSALEGRPFAIEDASLIEVEAGYQQSAAASQRAYRTVKAFLRATNVLPGTESLRTVPTFKLGVPVEKPPAETYDVFVENFRRVSRGEVYARADNRELQAEMPFYPILFSADGYRDIFGYAGELIED